MKREDMLVEIQYRIECCLGDEVSTMDMAKDILRNIEQYGMEPPAVIKRDGKGKPELSNEWED